MHPCNIHADLIQQRRENMSLAVLNVLPGWLEARLSTWHKASPDAQ